MTTREKVEENINNKSIEGFLSTIQWDAIVRSQNKMIGNRKHGLDWGNHICTYCKYTQNVHTYDFYRVDELVCKGCHRVGTLEILEEEK